jgi:hypothetical protein
MEKKLKKYTEHAMYLFAGMVLSAMIFSLISFAGLIFIAPAFYLGSYYLPFILATFTSMYYWGRKFVKETKTWQ